MSTATSAEVHAADISVINVSRSRFSIDDKNNNNENSASRNGGNSFIGMCSEANLGKGASSNNGSSDGSDINRSSNASLDSSSIIGGASPFASFSGAPHNSPTSALAAAAATIAPLVCSIPDSNVPSILAEQQQTAADKGRVAAMGKPFDADANRMMDCDYEVHSTPYSGTDGISAQRPSRMAAQQQQQVSTAINHMAALLSSPSIAATNTVSNTSTNSHSPLPSVPCTTHMSTIASTVSVATIETAASLAPRVLDLTATSATVLHHNSSGSAAARPTFFSLGARCQSPPATFNPAFTTNQTAVSFLSSIATPTTTSTTRASAYTTYKTTTASAITSVNDQGAQDIMMDSESDNDCEFSPLQTAQRVSGVNAADSHLSPQTLQRSEAHMAPIRSLTEALALSPRERPHHFVAPPGTEEMMRSMMNKIDDAHRFCERLLEIQEKHTRQINSLEVALQKINSAPATTLVTAIGSEAEPAPSNAALAPGLIGHRTQQIVQSQAQGQRLIQPRWTARAPEATMAATGSAESEMYQGRDPYATPQPSDQYGRSQPQNQSVAAAGYQSPPRSSSSVFRQYQFQNQHHQHQPRAAPYSARTSPAAQPAGSMAHSPRMQAHLQRHRGSLPAVAPASYRILQEPSSHIRRGSTHQSSTSPWLPHYQQQQQPAPDGSVHGAGEGESRGSLPYGLTPLPGLDIEQDERMQQQQQQNLISQQLLANQQPQPQQQQFFPPPSAVSASTSTFAFSAHGATGSSIDMHHCQFSTQPPPQSAHLQGAGVSRYAGSRIKRPRVGNPASDEQYSGSGASAESSSLRLLVPAQAHYHHGHHVQHGHGQALAILPPIHGGGGGGVAGQHLRPSGTPGSVGSGSAHMAQPDSTMMPARGTATHLHLRGAKSKVVGSVEMAQAERAFDRPPRGNPQAQPTSTWLGAQRHYKTALLHLLTLDSFYPSDVAMLNMYRQQGDFTSEQIEAYSAPLLSSARGWLRYNRNAVLRGTLDSKAKMPLHQLAEALQRDLHSEDDFTLPVNLRRCALLRVIYYQWRATGKLGTKSQSMFRDYEVKLRDIEAMATVEEQDAEWASIMQEEHTRRLALIRESRDGSGSTSKPKSDSQLQQQQQLLPAASLSADSSTSPTGFKISPSSHHLPQQHYQQQQQSLQSRRQSMDWQGYPTAEQPAPAGSFYSQQLQQSQQHYPTAFSSPTQQGYQQRHSQSQQHHHRYSQGHQQQQQQDFQYHLSPRATQFGRNTTLTDAKGHSGTGGVDGELGKDDDSEISVNLSPEPQ
ncbi:hypothetical protein BX661DRAFT_54919 [Kickxella alabastrina]|uniref:uncharacterized protein n=1 Tax=Kickxella alabastrina TaxID=61397 RepID=UPI00221F7A90|nr:uncharacterized protein BX661DRAFT_54919 [Kickxella alabastrina]KAI7823729.1 hypothetical protein BX661DRAFT_54919 [Kickxella alabastrina]